MDDFSWGNTRVVVGEGSNKRVMIDDDEKYDDSMIPMKRFSEYEAEAWETRSQAPDDRSVMTGAQKSHLGAGTANRGRSPSPLSQRVDYYQNTNPMAPSTHQSNNRHMPQFGGGMSLPPMSNYGGPQLTMPNFGGSQAGSEHGGNPYAGSMHGHNPAMSMHMGMPGYAGSMYGVPPMMQGQSMMSGLNMFGAGPPSVDAAGGGFRPMSTFSMSPTANPFPAGPSQSATPTDDELAATLRTYLGTQDLMTVTKKTAREAVAAQFPNADLSGKKDFLNATIDKILTST